MSFYIILYQWCKMSIQKATRDLKKRKIRSPNDAWRGYLKTRGLEPPTAAPSPQPIAIKLNPLWKTEVRKSAWIKPWCGSSPNLAIYNSDTTVCSSEILVSWYDNVISNYYFIAVGKLAHKVINIDDEWFNNWISYITLFYFTADCEQVFQVLNFYYSL